MAVGRTQFGMSLAVGVGAVLLVAALPAVAEPYIFTSIADTSGPFRQFESSAAVNNSGQVAFHAELDSLHTGIFKGAPGGVLTTIADSKAEFALFAPLACIDDAGRVLFGATSVSGSRGIHRGNGGATELIVGSDGSFQSFGFPHANRSGRIVFTAVLANNGQGVYELDSGSPVQIADNSGSLNRIAILPSGNSSGVVAFTATLSNNAGYAIFTGSGGALSTITDTSGDFDLLTAAPGINDDGDVVFWARGANQEGIYWHKDGIVSTVVDSSGPFSDFLAPAINNRSEIAFLGQLDVARHGIYTGANPVTDRVIETGDQLFGHDVVELGFHRGLNDLGQIAFYYRLENGVSGIALATPVPEPAAMALLLPGMMLLARRSRHAGRSA